MQFAADAGVRIVPSFIVGKLSDVITFVDRSLDVLPRRSDGSHLPTIEGFVVRQADGTRQKIVSKMWGRARADIAQCHPGIIWQALLNGRAIDLIDRLPVELRSEAEAIMHAIVIATAHALQSQTDGDVHTTAACKLISADGCELISRGERLFVDGCGWCPLSASAVDQVAAFTVGDDPLVRALFAARPRAPFRNLPFYEPSPWFSQVHCKGWDSFQCVAPSLSVNGSVLVNIALHCVRS